MIRGVDIMSKLSLCKSMSCAFVEVGKWIMDARMIIIPVLLIFIYSFAIEPLLANASLMGEKLNIFEPFVAVANSGAILLIVPLCFLTLISDYPKINNNTIFYIFRTGRLNWLTGQLVRLVMMALFYLGTIFIGSVVPVLFRGYCADSWSKVTTSFAIIYPEYSGNFGVQLLPENLYNQMSVFSAAIGSYLLVFAYLLVLGLILLLFSLVKKKTLGFIISGSVIAIGTALCSIKSELMWGTPMAHSIIWLHYTKYYRAPIVPIWVSCLYFCVLIIVLVILCYIFVRRFNYDNLTEIAY